MASVSCTSQIKLEIKVESLQEINPWIEQIWKAHHLPEPRRFDISLCLYEVVANIIMYGYDHPAGHHIHISLSVSGNRAQIIVEDDGKRFNPLDYPEVVLPSSISEAPIGGHGIPLIRRLSDSVCYQWCEPNNKLIITNDLTVVTHDNN